MSNTFPGGAVVVSATGQQLAQGPPGPAGPQGLPGPQGGSGVGVVNTSVVALRSTLAPGLLASQPVYGYSLPSDGGQGQFYWSPNDTRPDDGGTVLAGPNGSGVPGRWVRVVTDLISVRWFGAVGDGQRVGDATCAASTTLTSATAGFVAGDQGKLWTLCKAGGSVVATGTIAAVVSATQVTLSNAPALTCGTTNVTNVTNATPAVVTTSVAHGLTTGDYVTISGVLGATGVNGTWAVTVLTSTTFSVAPAAGGAYVSGGTVTYGGFFVWGTDDTAALTAAFAAVKTLLVSTLATAASVAPRLFFPPGDYCVTSGFAIDPSFSGCAFTGSSFWFLANTVSKITLMRPAAYLFRNTADGLRWSDLWLDGNRLAGDVMDFEYFGDTQTFDRCRFSGATNVGNLHHYGNLNGALEIDFVCFRECFLYGDFFDALYYAGCCILNENAQAFQIDYCGGLVRNAAVLVSFTNQGSCNFYGTQMFGWNGEAAITVNVGSSSFVLADIYNEQDTGYFLKIKPTAGATAVTSVTLRNCHLQFTPIYTCHTMRLVLQDSTISANIYSDPVSARFVGANGTIDYGIQQLVFDKCAILNGTSVIRLAGTITGVTNTNPAVVTVAPGHGLSTGDLVIINGVVGATGVNGVHGVTVLSATTFSVPVAAGGAYVSGGSVAYNGLPGAPLVEYRNTNFYGTATADIADGAMTATSKVLTSASSPFSQQSVGMIAHVIGAGSGGNDLWSPIVEYDTVNQVKLDDAAGATVSGAVVHIGNTGTLSPFGYILRYSNAISPVERVSPGGYDKDGVLLGVGSCPVGAGVPIIAADYHPIGTLTANRAFVLSTLGSAVGSRMRVEHTAGVDSFGVTLTYGATPTSITIVAGQYVEFEFVFNAGWQIVHVSNNAFGFQLGTAGLTNGTVTVGGGVNITGNSRIFLMNIAPSGTLTTTVRYEAHTVDYVTGGPGTGQFVIKALTSAGALNATDQSIVSYLIVG